MSSPLPVIVNGKSGTSKAEGEGLPDKLRSAFAAAGASAEIIVPEGEAIGAAIREAAARGPRVVIAGGDGTVNGAAQELAGSQTELALLPLGTLNHLARDLGLPTELDEAAALAATGTATAIDVGEVCGRMFVNNVSIGLYPAMVRAREGVQRTRGWPKWLSTVPAAWHALARLPLLDLKLELDGKGARKVSTSLLFVGNNAYSLDRGSVGERASLTAGRLSVYAVTERSRAGLVWFAARTLIGRAHHGFDFVAIGECETLKVTPADPAIELAMDGEVLRLPSPLAFRIRPGALRVVTP